MITDTRYEEPEVRVVAPASRDMSLPGSKYDADEWVPLRGCHTAKAVEAAILGAVGSDDWEMIQTAALPLGIGTETDELAEYARNLAEAIGEGIPAEAYCQKCEEHGFTLDPCDPTFAEVTA